MRNTPYTPLRYAPPPAGERLEVYAYQTVDGETRLRAPWAWGSDSPRWRTVELVEPVLSAAE